MSATGPEGLPGRLRTLAEMLRRGASPLALAGRALAPAGFLRLDHADRPRVESRALDAPWLLVVLAGSVTARTAVVTAHARAGEVLVLPARTRLELTRAPDGASEDLEVELLADALLRWLPAELDMAAELEAAALRPRPLGRATLASLVGLCEGVLAPGTHPWTLEHQLAGLLLALALEAGPDPARAERARVQLDLTLAVRQLVRERPAAPWSVSQAACRLGLSPATLRRRLARLGTGLRRLVQEERMVHARTLLGDGRLNVSEVAQRCGYESPAKFARQFKHRFGVVPSRYREAGPR